MKLNKLSGFLDLLKEPQKILSQNGKLMAIIVIIYLIIYSISFILSASSRSSYINTLVLDIFSLKSSQPGTPEYTQLLVAIREDIGIFLGIEVAYSVLFFFISLFAQTAVIIIASSYYNNDRFSLKDVMLKISKIRTRPFVTSFYVQLLTQGYVGLFFLSFLVPSLVLFDMRVILIAVLIILAIIFFTFCIYLSVVCILAVVVSVVEDSYGLSALGKARDLVKGKMLYGFLLSFLFILSLIVVIIVGAILSPMMPIVVGVIQTLFTGLVGIFLFMAYTAYYFKCKDDKTKLGGSEYIQIRIATTLDEDLP